MNDSHWALLRQLYGEAERSATGWDQAIADIERALEAGLPQPPKPPPATGGDIPF